MHERTLALVLLALAGCGGDSTDQGQAAEATLPKFNPHAQRRGKSVLEHAEMLDEQDTHIQLQALQLIGAFAVDGLPARDKVKRLLDRDTADRVKVMALATLVRMEAPEAPALVRRSLMDPSFLETPASYASLLTILPRVKMKPGALAADMVKLAQAHPNHAATVMVFNRLPTDAQVALSKAIFESEHGPEATKHFVGTVADLDFLDDAARLKYVRDNIAVAKENAPIAQQTLAKIGTEGALDLALELDTGHLSTRCALLMKFAAAKVEPQKVLDRMVADANARTQRTEVDKICRYMLSMCMNLKRSRPETVAGLHKSYGDAMAALTRDGPSPEHKAVGAAHLVRYVLSNKVPVSMVDPVLDVASDPKAPALVRNTATIQLVRNAAVLAKRDADYFVTRCVTTLYAGEGPEATDGIVKVLVMTGSRPDLTATVVDALAAKADAHLGEWSVNPAAAAMISLGGMTALHRKPAREKASIALGKMLVSPKASLGYLKQALGNRGRLVELEHNTVAGTIGMLAPTIFANRKTVNHEFHPEQMGSTMLRKPSWFAKDPASQAKWKAFLERVAAEAPEEFAKFAKTGLKNLG